MRIYNSLTRKKETLDYKPDERVNLFVCGPTTYGYSHIGHARTYLFYDALVKFLRKKLSWDVFYLQNITDIEDRIIDRAKEQKKNPLELAKKFEDLYYQDMDSLGVDSVTEYARATDYIPEIISQIERLVKKSNVYKIENDGYYFDVSTFPDYGKLSGRTVEQAEDGVSRIDESVNKKNKADFALWKFPKEDELSWESSLGTGRPGWHVEDTSITEKHFGATYHIHGGAIDLKFPHHEAEIALMESLSGVKPMVKTWIHAGFLNVDGKKMSKSKGNFITIKDMLEKVPVETFRMLVFSSHYRSPVNYLNDLVKEAQSRVDRLTGFARKLKNTSDSGSPFPYQEFIDAFWKSLKDDFNTPKALSTLFNLASEANKCIDSHNLSQDDAQRILSFIDEINAIFSIIPKEDKLTKEVAELVKEREGARKEKDFKKSDELRKEIEAKGYKVEDLNEEQRVYKK